MDAREKRLYAMFREVRTCFNLLRTLAEELHSDLDISPSMRAVMESLYARGAMTVPDIAREKGVSRQHIQMRMNELVSSGLAEAHDNPEHRRSSHFDLTGEGKKTFETMRQREMAPLQQLAATVPEKNVAQAQAALAAINVELRNLILKGDSHDS